MNFLKDLLKSKKYSGFRAYFYLLPALLILLVFRFYPILLSIYSSFFSDRIRGLGHFIGFANYRKLLFAPEFWHSLVWTIYFTLGVIIGDIFIALFFALLLNRGIKGLGFYRTAYFVPVVTSVVAVSIVWKWMFNRDGLFNHLFNLGQIDWLATPDGIFQLLASNFGITLPWWAEGPSVAMVAIIIVSIWKGVGYNIIIFLAGLQNIPKHLYEAAEIDGANRWHQFRHITWPMLSPTTFYIFIMSVVNSFQAFVQVQMLTNGSPALKTQILVAYLYDEGFDKFHYGYANAIALALFVIVLGLTIFQRKVLEKRVHY